MPDVSEYPKLGRITTLAGFKKKDLKVRRAEVAACNLNSRVSAAAARREVAALLLPSSC